MRNGRVGGMESAVRMRGEMMRSTSKCNDRPHNLQVSPFCLFQVLLVKVRELSPRLKVIPGRERGWLITPQIQGPPQHCQRGLPIGIERINLL